MPDNHYHVWTFSADYRTAYVHPVRFRARSSAATWGKRFHGGSGEGHIRLCDRPDSCGIDGDARAYDYGRASVSDARSASQLEAEELRRAR